ncbi:MAG: class II glutamine amidotransferase [Bdellovibrionales bacterium]|nr:class II glutamine amidotransferase [Bdellovibrionales bacterium]
MCRIFGFRSILQSGVHKSLIDADNSLLHQSERHPDGWGVAFYHLGNPHVVKLDQQARQCKIFEKISGVVSSNTLITHIRKSTVGSIGPLNTHPFQFGPWTFAHNGNLKDFDFYRDRLKEKIDPDLQTFILGETDSEYIFFLLLSLLRKYSKLEDWNSTLQISQILEEWVATITQFAGPLTNSKGDYDQNYLTFVLTNGQVMVAFQGGQSLFYSTHKNRCSERSTCSHFHRICEVAAQNSEKVHHLLVSSEQIKNENIWTALQFGEFVMVDRGMQFYRGQISLLAPEKKP